MHRLFVLAAFVLGCFGSSAAHALVPKVSGYWAAQSGLSSPSLPGLCAALSAYAETTLRPSNWFSIQIHTVSCKETSFNFYRTGTYAGGDVGGNFSPHAYYYPISSRLMCPANSHESSLTCACDDGFEEGDDGLSCIKPDKDPCKGLNEFCLARDGKEAEWALPNISKRPSSVCFKPSSSVIGGSGGTVDTFPGCNRGCGLATTAGVVRYEDENKVSFTTGYGNHTGHSCDPSENKEEDSDKEPEIAKEPNSTCKAGFKGTVDGVTVCVPPKSSSGVTEMETKDNGDGTKTESKTEVKCDGSQCQTTKTSTTTNTSTGGTVNSSSVTTTVDKADYCSKNKTAGVCKNEQGEEEGKGKFGGSCSGGFTCEGDALQCAMAKEQHKRSCELHVNESPESKLYEASKGKTGKVTDDLPGNETIALTDRIDTSSALGAGYCPLRDINVDAFGYSKVLPLSEHCEKIGYVKIFFVSFCLLLGLWIVFGRK